MLDIIVDNAYFCVAITLVAFYIGNACRNKWKKAIFNPIIIGAGLVMLTLYVLDIPLEKYQQDCKILSFLMTPATICLAISFYEQLQKLKKHAPAIVAGVLGGTLASLFSVRLLCGLFGFDEILTASMLPKSVTSAIGVVLSEQVGGVGALTMTVIIATGILGNAIGPYLTKLFRLKDPVSQGVGYGTAAHVIGTSRAMEISPLTGAVSSFSLTLSGLITAVLISFFI